MGGRVDPIYSVDALAIRTSASAGNLSPIVQTVDSHVAISLIQSSEKESKG